MAERWRRLTAPPPKIPFKEVKVKLVVDADDENAPAAYPVSVVDIQTGQVISRHRSLRTR
jgi:hypothetical protein